MKRKCCTKKYFLFVVVMTLFIGLLYFCIGTSKSKGEEYDMSQVNKEEIMRVGKIVDVYEGIGTNYNKITTLEQNSMVKRVEIGVGEADGHIWDKVILCNGKEGYVFSDNLEATTEGEYSKNTFEYEETTYDVYFPTLGENMEAYPYYVISYNNEESHIVIGYSKQRFVAIYNGTYDKIYRIDPMPTFKITIKLDGKVTTENDNKNTHIFLESRRWANVCVASNQDILKKGTTEKLFEKNCGYEYDAKYEMFYSCNDVVKLRTKAVVYEKAAVNYNEITILEENSIVKRVNSKVNYINGHMWDKIVLCNGKEGYVFSDNLEIALEEEYSNITFEYNNVQYNTYYPTLGENMKDYPYYVIGYNNEETQIVIGYSKQRFTAKYNDTYDKIYRIDPMPTFKITIKLDGKVTTENNNKNMYIFLENRRGSNICVASNQDILKAGTTEKLFEKNCGYEYDSSKESEVNCDEIVSINRNTIVYEKPAVNYNEMTMLGVNSIVKRVKYRINEANGHMWDKIILSNGKEGYVFSDNLGVVKEEYSNLSFEYQDVKYNVYFPTLGKNMEEYPYYVIGYNSEESHIVIGYSKQRFVAKYNDTYDKIYRVDPMPTFKVTIKLDGKVTTESDNRNMHIF